MKKSFLFLVFFLFLGLNQIGFAKEASLDSSLDRIVAIVNNQIIVNSELMREEQGFKKQLDPNSDAAKLKPEELRQKILKQLIDEALQLQLAKQKGIVVSEKALDAAISDIAKRNKLSLSAFKDTVKSHGLSYSDFRERIRKQMIIVRLQQTSIGEAAQVNDQEVDDFLRDKQAVKAVLQEYHIQKISKAQARALLYERKLKVQSGILLEKLRTAAYIKIMPL